jgi:hypothetical protein
VTCTVGRRSGSTVGPRRSRHGRRRIARVDGAGRHRHGATPTGCTTCGRTSRSDGSCSGSASATVTRTSARW